MQMADEQAMDNDDGDAAKRDSGQLTQQAQDDSAQSRGPTRLLVRRHRPRPPPSTKDTSRDASVEYDLLASQDKRDQTI